MNIMIRYIKGDDQARFSLSIKDEKGQDEDLSVSAHRDQSSEWKVNWSAQGDRSPRIAQEYSELINAASEWAMFKNAND